MLMFAWYTGHQEADPIAAVGSFVVTEFEVAERESSAKVREILR
jgi:hypothetical protein